jgi:hypothetical protein
VSDTRIDRRHAPGIDSSVPAAIESDAVAKALVLFE